MIKPYSRRQFLQYCSWTGLVLAGTAITACQNTEKPTQKIQDSTKKRSCDDLSDLGEEDLNARETFAYVKESPISESQCNNCKLWLPDKSSDTCGKCLLFKGPVNATGYCTYWAPQI